MKIICTQENLNKGLSIVSQAVGSDSTLPVLANVLIQTEGGQLKLSTTDIKTGITVKIRGKVEETGSVTVPAKLLSEYIRSLPAENITLHSQDKILKISCGDFNATLNGIDPEEFPLIPKIKDKEICSVDASDFIEIISKVSFAAASDESRPELAGVFMSLSGNQLTLAATDSYRLAEGIIKDVKISGKPKNAIVPAKTFSELLHIIGQDAEEKLKISLSENEMMFEYGDSSLVTRLVEGQYPDYKQIIPDNFQTEALYDREQFLQGIKVTGLFAKAGANDLRFEFNVPAQTTSLEASSSQVGKNLSKIKAKIKGETSEVIFNYRYLLDGLNSLKTEQVVFLTNSSSGPGILRSSKADGYTYVVMPIKQ